MTEKDLEFVFMFFILKIFCKKMIDVFVLLSQKFYLLLKQAISDRFRILFNICKEFSCISLYSLSPPSEVKLFSKVRNGNDFESVKPMNNGSGLSELHQGNLCINQHQSIIILTAPSYSNDIPVDLFSS